MSNSMLKFKFGLKARLGLIPGTSRLESRQMELQKEYESFLEYERSGQPQRFRELEETVTSQDFRDRKKFINRQKFKGSDAYNRYLDYDAMKKSPLFKGYFKFAGSKYFPDFQKFDDSSEIKQLEAGNPDGGKDLNTLRKSPGIKAYYKLRKSKYLENYRRLEGSPELEKFWELENYINSEEFKNTRYFLKSGNKFKKTPEYQQLLEYKELKRSRKLKWYFKLKGSGQFDEIKKWKLVFSDDFTGKNLDRSKWLTTFFWGEELLKQGYSLASDKHFYTEEGNHEIENNLLKIYTRKEAVNGQAWDPAIGFYPKEYEYTSGLVNTGRSFRQKYGAFEAKVRMHPSTEVFHAFWMLSDRALPHIDVFRFSGQKRKRIWLNNYWQKKGSSEKTGNSCEYVGGIDFSKGFFIYRFEWYPEKLVWKINNTAVKTETRGIPEDPMYILFSSGIDNGSPAGGLPTSLDIDWVRCYEFSGTKDE